MRHHSRGRATFLYPGSTSNRPSCSDCRPPDAFPPQPPTSRSACEARLTNWFIQPESSSACVTPGPAASHFLGQATSRTERPRRFPTQVAIPGAAPGSSQRPQPSRSEPLLPTARRARRSRSWPLGRIPEGVHFAPHPATIHRGVRECGFRRPQRGMRNCPVVAYARSASRAPSPHRPPNRLRRL